ncbi:hypothetical protein SDC9_208511 [bioreactor metagenome]|uniref:Uncharacterized protein n=1 Tax=bioreactor metagenome TaxID=1076179 RepID=A0A645JDM5_9ZZZZ
MPREDVREPDQARRDPGRVHEVAGHHEERDGQQRERLRRTDHLLDRDLEGHEGFDDEKDDPGDSDRERDRHFRAGARA